MQPVKPSEQRHHVRYRLNNALFADIQGGYFTSPASIIDLNRMGFSIYSEGRDKELTGKFIALNLVSDRNRAILRSLSARVVYSCAWTGENNGSEQDEAPKRYGLQFVNLSTLEKRLLDRITKKYSLPG